MSTEQTLRRALEIYADSDNWYDEEPFRRSGPVPAWRGPNEDHPEEIARAALALPASEPSPDVLRAADALVSELAKERCHGCFQWFVPVRTTCEYCEGIDEALTAYRTARGPQPEPTFRERLQNAADEALSPVKPQGIGELIRGAEKK